jgi:hypothetical protein
MASLPQAVVNTLIYSDIFHYPLTEDELLRYLHTDKRVSRSMLRETLVRLRKIVSFSHGYYALKGREDGILLRKTRMIASEKKLAVAKKTIAYLTLVPTIQFIGISGSLAMKNAGENDDIDLFIISNRNSIWITRLIVYLLLKARGVQRHRTRGKAENRFCVNMYLDECTLTFPSYRQTLYTAHEIAQLYPVFDRKNTYKRFFKANRWMKRYLMHSRMRQVTQITHPFQRVIGHQFFVTLCILCNSVAKRLQLWYMKDHKTREEISDTLLAFHPYGYEIIIEKQYQQACAKYLSVRSKLPGDFLWQNDSH